MADRDWRGAARPCARADLATVEVGGELVVYDRRAEALHLLNPTATAIWGCLDGSATFDDLAVDLIGVFEGDPDRIAADLGHLLDDLADRGLLAGPGP